MKKKRDKYEYGEPIRAYGVIFADHLADIGGDAVLYKSVKQAVDLCDSALRNVKSRVAVSDKLHEFDKRLREFSYIQRMSDKEIRHFKSLLESFAELTKERGNLLERLSKFDRSLPALDRIENQADEVIPEMRDAEEYRRALKHDISFLEGEKEGLRSERDTLRNGIGFISKFSVGLTGLFVFTAVMLGFMAVIQGVDVFMYSVALIFLAVTAAAILYVFRKRISLELSMNSKRQQKAIHVLNQKNTVYAFYHNFLGYCYDKYHVRSAQMLQSHLKDYEQYKQVVKRIDHIRSVMYETQREIEDIMREKGIDQALPSLEGFAKALDLDNLKRSYGKLIAAQKDAERKISELERQHEEIWDLLTRLKEDRPSARERVEGVIQTYLDEVGRILAEGAAT